MSDGDAVVEFVDGVEGGRVGGQAIPLQRTAQRDRVGGSYALR